MTHTHGVARADVVRVHLAGRAAGLSNREMAAQLDMLPATFKSAVERARADGDLEPGIAHQPNARRRDEVLEDFVMIKDSVTSLAQAADRMGMTLVALDKALERARAAGDERGIYAPLSHGRKRGPRKVSDFTRARLLKAWPALRLADHTYTTAAAELGCDRRTLALAVRWAIDNGHPAGLVPRVQQTGNRHPRRTA